MKQTHSPEQNSAAQLMKVIEEPQRPDRKGFDPFTLEEMMERLKIPGVFRRKLE